MPIVLPVSSIPPSLSRHLQVKDEGVNDARISDLDGQLLQDLRRLDDLVLLFTVHTHERLRQSVRLDRQLPVRSLDGIVQDHHRVVAQVFLRLRGDKGRGQGTEVVKGQTSLYCV